MQSYGPADFRDGFHTQRCLTSWVEEIAEGIADKWQRRLSENLGEPPEHIIPASTDVPPPATKTTAKKKQATRANSQPKRKSTAKTGPSLG